MSNDIFQGRGEMRAIMRSLDWSQTPLGPVETWPPSLRTTVQTMLGSRYAMWMGWGPDLIFLYNDTYGRVTLGKKHPWALGKPAREVWSEIWKDLEPRIKTVFSTGEATWDEGLQLFLERNGFPEETYHTFSYSPLTDDDGRVAGMLCVVTEETERVLGERRLSSLRELAASLTRAKTESAVGLAIAESLARSDRDLPFTLVYTVSEDRSTAVLASQTGFLETNEMLAPERIDLTRNTSIWPLQAVLQEGQPVVVELTSLPSPMPKGAWPESPLRAVAIPIAGRGDDAPMGILISGLNRYLIWDETYRGFLDLVAGQIAGSFGSARAYDQERRRAEALTELDRAKTAFFSNVSHELRTPLTLMLGPLEDEIAAARSEDRNSENLEILQRNGLRLLKLVNTLLEFSRVESGRVEARFRAIDLPALTSNLASIFRSAIERTGLSYRVETETLSAPAYIDPEMWEKIVLNLISNAFKSTFDGSITVRVTERKNHALLEVSDTGTGIPRGEVPYLFERFRRVEGARRRTHEGSGIGLALVHELVKMHGGSISVQTEEGRGTTFWVEIPLGAAHLPEERVQPAGEMTPGTGSAYTQEAEGWFFSAEEIARKDDSTQRELRQNKPTHPEATVLVVDDNRDMRDYVSRLLGRRFHVRSAEDGKVALSAILESPPDLVLSDVMMPEMDGFGLLAAIRAHPDIHDLPVILLSARAGEESRVEGIEAGADDYLVKPFTARELVARVTAHVTMHKVRRAAAERERELLQQTEAERERLRDLLLQAPAAICVLSGPEHRFTLANEMYLKLIGAERGLEILNKSLLEALPEIASQGFNELLDRVYTTGEPFVGREQPVTLARGKDLQMERVYLNFVYQPWRRADGTIEGVFVHAVDVTESVLARQTVEQLAASVQRNEARLQAILQQVVSGICQLGDDGLLEFYNERLAEIAGRSIPGLQQTSFFDLLHSNDIEETRKGIQALFANRKPIELVQRWLRPNGSEVWVQQNFSAVVEEQGRVRSVVCVVQDITAKKDAEEALRRNEKLAAVGQLASTIAHEINNPLESVTNLLYLMNGTDSVAELKEYAQTASSELMRVSHVVHSTLRFHRQPIELSFERVRSLLQSAVTLFQARIRSSEIKVIYRFRDSEPIWCYSAELRQVFTNLIGNAFDAVRTSPERRLYIRTQPRKNSVRITIADTGHGMDAATRKRIFDPFFTTKGMSGSGLGLWLSLEILKKHRAKAQIKSVPGRGTVFSIDLPVLPAPPK